ncbi:MAG: hypothetical protein KatS3mg102_2683 [Planctomycetota bacterium]|nr:MAG: hypothetical protein KatS3mg102_2683 [Planctomycetota bacterium]
MFGQEARPHLAAASPACRAASAGTRDDHLARGPEARLQRHQEKRVGRRRRAHLGPERPQARLGQPPQLRVHAEPPQQAQHQRRHRVARGHRPVVRLLDARDPPPALAHRTPSRALARRRRGEPEPAAFGPAIVEQLHHLAGQPARRQQPAQLEVGLVQLQQPPAHERIVVEKARDRRLALAPAVQQPPVFGLHHVLEHEGGRPLGGSRIPRGIERAAGERQRRDREPVPVGEHLVVAVRPHPSCPRPEQPRAERVQARAKRRRLHPQRHRGGAERLRQVEDVAPGGLAAQRVEVVAVRAHAVGAREQRPVLGPEHFEDLRPGPGVVPPLLALGLRVLGTVEPTRRVGQLPQHILERLARHLRPALAAGRLVRLQVGAREQRLVIEHLLEVRHQPALIHRVPRKPATQLIVDPPGRHPVARQQHLLHRTGQLHPRSNRQQKQPHHRLGKLRRPAEPAVHADRSSRIRSAARRNRAGLGRPAGPLSNSRPAASCRRKSAAARRISPRRCRHNSATRCNTIINEGRPCRGSGGKYVPPKNGSPSGVQNTDKGQPPSPAVACTNAM